MTSFLSSPFRRYLKNETSDDETHFSDDYGDHEEENSSKDDNAAQGRKKKVRKLYKNIN